jgi:hypothetical protein
VSQTDSELAMGEVLTWLDSGQAAGGYNAGIQVGRLDAKCTDVYASER